MCGNKPIVLGCRQFPGTGGTARFIQAFASALIDRGYRVVVVAFQWNSEPLRETIQAIDIHRIPVGTGSWSHRLLGEENPNFLSGIRARLNELLSEIAPQVVVCRTLSLAFGSEKACSRLGIPLAYWPPSIAPDISIAHIHGGSIRLKLAQLRSLPIRYLVERHVLRKVNRVFTLSHQLEQDLYSWYGIRDVCVIYPGVDAEAVGGRSPGERREARLGMQLDEDVKVVSTVSRLSSERNLHDLLTAMRIIAERQNTIQLIAGDGPLRNRCESKLKKWGVIDRIRLLGFVKDISRVYSASDIYLNASKRDSFGHGLAEALYSGVPVVAYDSKCKGVRTTAREIIGDNLAGVLVSPPMPDNLAHTITALLDKSELLEEMSQAGAELARQLFDWSLASDRFLANMDLAYTT